MRNYKAIFTAALAVATLISAPVFGVISGGSTSTPSSTDQLKSVDQTRVEESRTFKSTDTNVDKDINKDAKSDVFKKDVKVDKNAPGFKSDSVKSDSLNRNASDNLNDSAPL